MICCIHNSFSSHTPAKWSKLHMNWANNLIGPNRYFLHWQYGSIPWAVSHWFPNKHISTGAIYPSLPLPINITFWDLLTANKLNHSPRGENAWNKHISKTTPPTPPATSTTRAQPLQTYGFLTRRYCSITSQRMEKVEKWHQVQIIMINCHSGIIYWTMCLWSWQ